MAYGSLATTPFYSPQLSPRPTILPYFEIRPTKNPTSTCTTIEELDVGGIDPSRSLGCGPPRPEAKQKPTHGRTLGVPAAEWCSSGSSWRRVDIELRRNFRVCPKCKKEIFVKDGIETLPTCAEDVGGRRLS
ncbi:hypothetical protein SCAR479_02544 [Seiridium cardinale]|uniref:Uncharacterized protein n=1 Tax=Seiridium cardinale TaxID=138064 RepID=A0ABR2Y2W7_9PEZI